MIYLNKYKLFLPNLTIMDRLCCKIVLGVTHIFKCGFNFSLLFKLMIVLDS